VDVICPPGGKSRERVEHLAYVYLIDPRAASRSEKGGVIWFEQVQHQEKKRQRKGEPD
jgi:hypothetical protein